MHRATTLAASFADAVRARPDHTAVEEPPGFAVTWAELDTLASRVATALRAHGIGPGDRVGIYLPKSIDAVAAIHGVLRTGAAYVPVDPEAPAARCAFILNDCGVAAVMLTTELDAALEGALDAGGAHRIKLPATGGGAGLAAALDALGVGAAGADPADVQPDSLAYILYTSGSTGRPKGVMLTHENACSFVEWCSREFTPTGEDRFSSHAPFHFDLSVLDLYLPVRHAATLVLVPSAVGKEPTGLADLIASRRLTFWYSTPSILSMLAEHGKMERHNWDALHTVLFAGEVFPIKHLRALKARLPHVRLFNLYGPTETNVCTSYRIPDEIAESRTEPFPIGPVLPHLHGRLIDAEGADVATGEEGELCIAGAHVMQGYWNLPERTAQAFLEGDDGARYYRTGDIVVDPGDGVLTFVGRRDRMVKRRGYRIELGEIEAGLYTHPALREVAVVAAADPDRGTIITAFLSGHEGKPPSVIELKQFCARALPKYMVPDRFVARDALPRTSTDKIDYQQLQQAAGWTST